MSLFEQLDNLVDNFVNISLHGKENCKNLVIVFGDSKEETISPVGQIVEDPKLKEKTLAEISTGLDRNFGLNLFQTLQPNLICHNGSTSTFLTLVRNSTKNSTTLEEFIMENYFTSKIIKDHFSSVFKAVSLIQLSILEQKVGKSFDRSWTQEIMREISLEGLIVANSSSHYTNATADSRVLPEIQHLLDVGRRIQTEARHVQSLRNFWFMFSYATHHDRMVWLRKDMHQFDQHFSGLSTTAFRDYNPSFTMELGMIQSIPALVSDMNEKFAITLFNGSADCFLEKLASHRISDFRASSLRHWADSNVQRLYRMREQIGRLSSPSKILHLVEETMTGILGVVAGETKCIQSRDKVQELVRFETFLSISAKAVFEIYGLEPFVFLSHIEASWIIPYNKLVDHEKDSGIWYALIHTLLRGLSSYHFQQRRSWYNVQLPEDYGIPNKSQGMEITSDNFYRFASKFGFLGHESYGKLKLVDLTPRRLHETNAVLKTLLGSELTIGCNDGIFIISGNYITLSEIVKLRLNETECPGDYGALSIFATSTIYVDADVTIIPKFRAINLTLIAPFVYWNAVGDCKLIVEYQSKDVIWGFPEPNNFYRVKDGSLFHAVCSGDEEITQTEDSEMGNDLTSISGPNFVASTDTAHLLKIFNRFKLFARSRTLERNFVNLNLFELLHSFETDVRILDFYDLTGFLHEFQLLKNESFYEDQCTTDDLVFYLRTLFNNTETYLERLPLLMPSEIETAKGTSVRVRVHQLQDRVAAWISHLKENGRDKPYQEDGQLDKDPENTADSNRTHLFSTVVVSLLLLGLASSLLFGIVLAVRKHSDIIDLVRDYFMSVSNGFRRMRNESGVEL